MAIDARGGSLGGSYKKRVDNITAAQDVASAKIAAANRQRAAFAAAQKKKSTGPGNPSKPKKKKVQKIVDKTPQGPVEPSKTYLGISGMGSVKLVKIPENNVLQITKPTASDGALEQLFFDSIGTTEIINIARHDDINTVNNPYMPIKDMSDVNYEYSPNKLVSMQKTASQYFNQFGIDLDVYQPSFGTGPGGSVVYLDGDTGDLVVNVIGMPSNYRVEIQVMTFDELISDTIYT
jgi:hypothetical protein